MVGSIGKYLFIFPCHVDMQQVTVLAVLGGFRLRTSRQEATTEARDLMRKLKALRLDRLMVIVGVWTLSRSSTSGNGYVHCIL